MDTKQLTKYAQKNGLTIAIGHPMEWIETADKCRLNKDTNKKRLYAFSSVNNLGMWEEPSEYCSSLSELKIMIDEELSNISGQS